MDKMLLLEPVRYSDRMNLPSMFRFAIATSFLFASVALAQEGGAPAKNPVSKEIAAVAPIHPMYLGSLNMGLKTNDAYIDGNFSIVAPVWSSLGLDATLSGGMVFIEPYISWGEEGEVATSLGFGYRHLIGRQSVSVLAHHDGHQASFFEEGVMLGGNLFVDMLDTQTNHQFWQLGVGAEVLTRYVELRGNYYIPLTDKKEVGSFRTKQSFESTSYQSSVTHGDPYATGNSILQSYTQTVTATTSTTTIERLFRQYEEGMEGWDFEVGVLIPWLDRWMDAKVITGYYAFDNQPFGPQTGGAGNVEGWKLGLELRPVPALVLNSTWYEDERLTGADWTVGVRLEIPFEAGDLGDGKNLWRRIEDAFRPRRRHLVERVAEPVRRQNAAVKIAHSTDEDEEQMQSSVHKVTKVVSHTQGQLVLADDIVFVNDGPAVGNGIQAGSATGTGTAEQPVLTIQAGADIAGPNSNFTGRVWSVYTQGVATFYTGDVTVSGSTNFFGSGMPIIGGGGKIFGIGPPPVLVGGIEAFGVGFLGVSGYVITTGLSGTGDGIHANDIGTVKVINNAFHDIGNDAVDVISTGSTITSLLVTGNFFNRSGDNAVEIDSTDDAIISAIISGNSFLETGANDVDVIADINARLTLLATSNVVVAGFGNAFSVQSFLDSKLAFSATGNTILNQADSAILLGSFDDSTLNALISGNLITDGSWSGVEGMVNDESTMNITIVANTIARMGFVGIDLSTCSCFPTLNAAIMNNNISFIPGPAITIGNFGTPSAPDAFTVTALITGNNIFGTGFTGIDLEAFGDSTTLATIAGNTVTATSAAGIFLGTAEASSATVAIIGNNISFAGNEGIWVDAVDFSTLTLLTLAGNSINSTGFGGIHVDVELDAVATVAVNSNVIVQAGEEGLGLNAFDNGNLTATSVAGNVIAQPFLDGVNILTFDGTSVVDIAGFNNNVITGFGGDGIHLDAATGSLFDFNGTTNNIASPAAFDLGVVGSPSGTFFLNGALITLP